jgi:hypothetical protein
MNLILPPQIKTEPFQLTIYLLKAESLPKLDTLVGTNDPYVVV